MASKKHYYKLADILGTFKYYLIHDDIDITCEFDNLVEGVCNILSSDNNQFNDEKFRDEIKSKCFLKLSSRASAKIRANCSNNFLVIIYSFC